MYERSRLCVAGGRAGARRNGSTVFSRGVRALQLGHMHQSHPGPTHKQGVNRRTRFRKSESDHCNNQRATAARFASVCMPLAHQVLPQQLRTADPKLHASSLYRRLFPPISPTGFRQMKASKFIQSQQHLHATRPALPRRENSEFQTTTTRRRRTAFLNFVVCLRCLPPIGRKRTLISSTRRGGAARLAPVLVSLFSLLAQGLIIRKVYLCGLQVPSSATQVEEAPAAPPGNQLTWLRGRWVLGAVEETRVQGWFDVVQG